MKGKLVVEWNESQVKFEIPGVESLTFDVCCDPDLIQFSRTLRAAGFYIGKESMQELTHERLMHSYALQETDALTFNEVVIDIHGLIKDIADDRTAYMMKYGQVPDTIIVGKVLEKHTETGELPDRQIKGMLLDRSITYVPNFEGVLCI